ncbi:MAG: TonB-dependent receptor plug domain-containing protein, partial [Muribaculaceae bacterium]|nr:TonB-dependent receptor plug domain-containing protein [Muribaculaceae bacterium]
MDKLRVILLLLVGFLPAWLSMSAQSLTVSGTVNDKEGEPIIGATVRVDNSKEATATDIDGNFTLKVAKYPAAITVSSIGYQAKKVTISSAAPVTIELAEDSEMLEEVVVIGYGTVRKADLAGSVSVVDSKAFSAQPVTTVGEALQGRVSGVNVISGGVPGASPKIRIRGANSINKSNEPLYVVDGLVRESGLEGINPEDIASMQILKDASSTAIYGS